MGAEDGAIVDIHIEAMLVPGFIDEFEEGRGVDGGEYWRQRGALGSPMIQEDGVRLNVIERQPDLPIRQKGLNPITKG